MKSQGASRCRVYFLLAILLATVSPAAAKDVFHSPGDLAFSPDGASLAVADATGASLVLIDPATREITATVALTAPPDGLAWSGDGRTIFVAEAGVGQIAEISADQGAVTRRFTTGRHTRGLAVAPRRGLLLACDWGLDVLAVIDPADGTTRARIPVGRQPFHVAITPDESLAVVSNLLPASAATDPHHASDVTLIDLEKLAAVATVRLPSGSSNARGVAIDHTGKSAFVVHTLGRVHLPTTQLDRGWVNTNALSIIDLASATLTATLLLDQMTDGAADPWGVAIDSTGTRLHITLSGVHQLAVVDLEGLPAMLAAAGPTDLANDLAALYRHGLIHRIDLPAVGPRGVSTAPNGGPVAVAGYFTGNVVLVTEDSAPPVAIALGPQPEPDPVRRGEIAFHDAGLCYQRWLSCATCHPGARVDGLNWDLLNDGVGNPKNTRSMLLSHATPPVMSLGVRASMEVAARAGFIHIQFTEPDPDDLEAVIAYLRSLEPAASPYLTPDGALSEAAARGREVFHRESVGCAKCHPGPLFTNLALLDVGTATPLDHGATRYDTSTLVEIWRTPPYLHDGRAATLHDVFIEHNADDRHGKTSTLDSAEVDDLVEYLRSL